MDSLLAFTFLSTYWSFFSYHSSSLLCFSTITSSLDFYPFIPVPFSTPLRNMARRQPRWKWATPRAPRYIENEDRDRATAPIICRECRQITFSLHACDPVCSRCSTHFLPGRGCPDLCGAIPCCGCCDQLEKPDNSVFVDGDQEHEEAEVTSECDGLHNPPVRHLVHVTGFNH